MARPSRLTLVLALVQLLALGLSGCLSDEEEDAGSGPATITVWKPAWQNESFTGQLPASNPVLLTPGVCEVRNEGEEDVQSKRHLFTPENATVSARLELAFTAAGPTTVTPVGYTYPDMDLLLLDPAGNEVSGCEAATGGNPEVLTLGLTMPGEYTALVVNFASVGNEYELKVSLRYAVEETIEVTAEEPATDGNETA